MEPTTNLPLSTTKNSVIFCTSKYGFPLRVNGSPNYKIYTPPPFSYLKNTNITYITYDDYFNCDNQIRADLVLLDHCINNKVDAVFICCQQLIGAFDDGIALRTLQDLGIPTILIWLDTADDGFRKRIENFTEMTTLQIFYDDPIYAQSNPNYLWRWAPPMESFYQEPGLKDIDVSFVGNYKGYPDRMIYLEYLEKRNIKIEKFGGIGFSWQENQFYDTIFKRSKITINFSRIMTGIGHQTKARIFEATSTGCLLLESINPVTPTIFEPMTEYIPFGNPEDLAEKLIYYSSHEQERNEIAQKGRKKCLEKYNMAGWWAKIYARIKERGATVEQNGRVK